MTGAAEFVEYRVIDAAGRMVHVTPLLSLAYAEQLLEGRETTHRIEERTVTRSDWTARNMTAKYDERTAA